MIVLIIGLCVYAAAGSPTPDTPGALEVFISLCLILAVGMRGGLTAIIIKPEQPIWQGLGGVLLTYGLSVSIILGVGHGHDPALILRDVLPFLFMMMPVFLVPLFQRNPDQIRLLIIAILVVGLGFAVRAIGEQVEIIRSLLFLDEPQELTYFANAATVRFSGLFFLGWASVLWVQGCGLRSGLCNGWIYPAMLLLLACIALTPLILTTQRASLGYAAVYSVILLGLGLWRYPIKILFLLGILTILGAFFHEPIQQTLQVLTQKTDLVGFNKRPEEWRAIWNAISDSPFTTIFGLGWGGTFESPAVGEVRVNFAHGLLPYMVLKTGVLGLALTVSYLYFMLKRLWVYSLQHPVFVFAVIGPVLIDIFLYASFKSLDFGLILLLVPISAHAIETRQSLLYQN